MQANACATRRCPRVARTCFAAALALLFDLENNVGSSKAAATAGFAEGKTEPADGKAGKDDFGCRRVK